MASELTIDLTGPIPPVESEHLQMGATSPTGLTLGVNRRYLTRDGKPWLPVMGEVHYSRISEEDWEEQLRRCKAGGIEIVACYAFWIHHEEVEGEFEFLGARDLRRFVQTCRDLGLYVWLRLGPWCHGECRNGGLPDWVLQQCPRTRENNPTYLALVERYWRELHAQVDGQFFAQGGPIIGVQLENELMQDALHLSTLRDLADRIGFDVPYHTVTGWGDVHVPPGVLPVFGGYADGFWERSTTDWPLRYRKNFFFRLTRNDTNIGNDLNPSGNEGEPVDPAEYPYLTCETGGGMPSSFHRRIALDPQDTEALAYVMVGSGSNLQGYYMYHGGINPEGKRSTLQESQATGYPNDLPIKTYFADAPLGDWGQINPIFHRLRRLHYLLSDFGDRLAPCVTVLPDQLPAGLEDRNTLRWCVRHDGSSGFVFINTHQRGEPLPPHSSVQFRIKFPTEELVFPQDPIHLPSGLCAILPLNQEIDGVRLRYSTAQPLALHRHQGRTTLVLGGITGISPQLLIEGTLLETDGFSAKGGDGLWNLDLISDLGHALFTGQTGSVEVLVIATENSDQFQRVEQGGQVHLLLSRATMLGNSVVAENLEDLNVLDLRTGERLSSSEYSNFDQSPTWRLLSLASATVPIHMGSAEVAEAPPCSAYDMGAQFEVTVQSTSLAERQFLEVDYVGCAAQAWVGETLVTDHFFNGEPWRIGLKGLPEGAPIRIKIVPLEADTPIYLEPSARDQVDLAGSPACLVRSVRVATEYQCMLSKGEGE